MKISELKNAPQWLLNAKTENENVEIVYGVVVWRGGTWLDGLWYNGVWHNGEWRGGEWLGGLWHNGEWRGGEWLGGLWHNGEWLGGLWHNGEWRGGLWHGGEWRDEKTPNRILFMAAAIGVVFDAHGFATAYRTTNKNGSGRYTHEFVQKTGKYFERDLPPAGSGTCKRGIHVTTAARAWTYFGVDPTCQLWEVKFHRRDMLDCDGEKIRIRGGVFRKIKTPWSKKGLLYRRCCSME